MTDRADYLVIWYNDDGHVVRASQAIDATWEQAEEFGKENMPVNAAEHEARQLGYMTSKESKHMTISVGVAAPMIPAPALRAVVNTAIDHLATHVEEAFKCALEAGLAQLCMNYGVNVHVVQEWQDWSKRDLVSVEVEIR